MAMIILVFEQGVVTRPADIFNEGATRSETAAFRQIDLIRCFVIDEDSCFLVFRIRHGNGGKQNLRVGMNGVVDNLIYRADFENFAEIHDGDPVAKILDR